MNVIYRNVVLFLFLKEKYFCLGINLSEWGIKKWVVFKREVIILKLKGEVFFLNILMKCDWFIGFKWKLGIFEDFFKNEL